jgi:hypothetical protein
MAKRLVRGCAKLGYGEYRAHLDFMDLAADQHAFNEHAYRRFCETVEDALDPNGNPGAAQVGDLGKAEARPALAHRPHSASWPAVSVHGCSPVCGIVRREQVAHIHAGPGSQYCKRLSIRTLALPNPRER